LTRREFHVDSVSQQAFQFVDAVAQFVQRLTLRIGQLSVFELVPLVRSHSHDTAGNTDDSRMIGNWLHDNRASADFDVVADRNIAEDFRPSADDYLISYGGVALALFFPRAPNVTP
jgi:hypothetical protein